MQHLQLVEVLADALDASEGDMVVGEIELLESFDAVGNHLPTDICDAVIH
jgi:hypothetical protein